MVKKEFLQYKARACFVCLMSPSFSFILDKACTHCLQFCIMRWEKKNDHLVVQSTAAGGLVLLHALPEMQIVDPVFNFKNSILCENISFYKVCPRCITVFVVLSVTEKVPFEHLSKLFFFLRSLLSRFGI